MPVEINGPAPRSMTLGAESNIRKDGPGTATITASEPGVFPLHFANINGPGNVYAYGFTSVHINEKNGEGNIIADSPVSVNRIDGPGRIINVKPKFVPAPAPAPRPRPRPRPARRSESPPAPRRHAQQPAMAPFYGAGMPEMLAMQQQQQQQQAMMARYALEMEMARRQQQQQQEQQAMMAQYVIQMEMARQRGLMRGCFIWYGC